MNRKKWVVVFTLWYFCHCQSIQATIRYGFLEDSFSKRGISGTVYGFTEGSVIFGYLGIYFTNITERLMKHFDAKHMFCGFMLAFTCCTGVTEMIYYMIPDNSFFVPLSVVLRIVQGAVGYATSLLTADFLRAQFPDQFDILHGCIFVAIYSGEGVAEAVGCPLYDHYGYYAPYIFTTCTCIVSLAFCAVAIPSTACNIAHSIENDKDNVDNEGNEDVDVDDGEDDADDSRNNTITWLIALPLLATALININTGYLHVTLSPYLHHEFGKSISYAGLVLTAMSLGMGIGSFISGMMLQRKLLNTYDQMGIGAFY